MSNTNKEVIMNDNKVKATAAAENLQEALVLRPEWEIKPKQVEKLETFTVTLNEKTNVIELIVNNEIHSTITCKSQLYGKIKFHDALSYVIAKFDLWRLHEKN